MRAVVINAFNDGMRALFPYYGYIALYRAFMVFYLMLYPTNSAFRRFLACLIAIMAELGAFRVYNIYSSL
jgi:hypothetical protein